MLHILLTSNTAKSMYNFRAPLIKFLLNQGYKVTVLAQRDDYAQPLMQLGCQYIDLPIDPNGMNPLWDLRLCMFYQRIFSKLRPDCVISYTIKSVIYSSVAAGFGKTPFVSVITGLGSVFMQENLLTKFVRVLYKLSQKKAHRVVFLNSSDQDEFLDHNIIEHSQAYVLPGEGVDTEHFYCSPLPSPSPVTFLYCGRLLIDKGLRDFYHAAMAVKAVYHEGARFQVLGPIEEPQHSVICQQELSSWTKHGVIEYLGSTNDVRPFIQQAHCVVLPTRYREGLPRCLLEAASMGRIMIASSMPGCADLVRDGQNGYLCKPADVQDLIDKMMQVMQLSGLDMQQMAQNGRKDVEEKFSMRHVIACYEGFLQGIPGLVKSR